ncbi:MAG: response regulator [Rhodospirillaceae bacterium]|jgi:CheY-like chemotaxis protein|nr:response regulator [Rhodospirillaceae bacterium]MBT5457112.1 response regulator [Rhodospirillaceae bacterium]
MARILIVDDDNLVRDALRLMLNREGHNVIEAQDGKEAIGSLRQHGRFDLVVTDLIMPDMEGIETISSIRKMASDVPILAISGGARLDPRQLLQLAISHGANEAIAKPVDRKAFLKIIRRLLPEEHLCNSS